MIQVKTRPTALIHPKSWLDFMGANQQFVQVETETGTGFLKWSEIEDVRMWPEDFQNLVCRFPTKGDGK